MCITPATFSAKGGGILSSGRSEVSENSTRFTIPDQGSFRHLEDEVSALFPMLPFSPSVLSPFGDVCFFVFIIEECGKVFRGLQDYMSPSSAVSPVRTATGNEFFPSERDTSIPAFPGPDTNESLIDKMH